MVKRIAVAVPGDLATPTGGYAYDRRIIHELEQLDWKIDVVRLGDGFPYPSVDEKQAAHTLLTNIPASRPIVIDGLAFGVLPDVAAELLREHALIALVHHPLALESGLSAAQAEAFRMSEQAALASARRAIVTSATTARLLAAEYGVAADRITVACPGIDPVAPARGSSDGIVRLLSVGAIVPRKGYDILIAALAMIKDLPWLMTIVGARSRDPAAAESLDPDISRFGLADRVSVLGAVSADRLAELYMKADLFTLASRYEGYGMVFSEAIAFGLPIVGTHAGAIADTVPAGAGLLVPPDDPAALASALRSIIEDPAERRRIAKVSREAARTLPSWRDSAAIFASALDAVA
ncbi:MAG: glycosyltransferase family 4 protein [Methylobacteriaceae bacterium]|nr:glycosyltransferase family 4 protein [Methylobacteriaceae bacterium]